MIDLVLHKEEYFVPLGETTSDPKVMAAQAFMILFLTKEGSIGLEPDLGVGIEVGSTNVVNMTLKMQKAVNTIFETMKVPYNLESIEIENLEEVEDTVMLTVRLTSDDFSTVLNFSL